MTQKTREFHLARRPHGVPVADDYRLVERELPDPAEGDVLIRNVALSIDPYMRPRMNDVPSYIPPFQIDEPMPGGAVGEVIASHDPRVPEGSMVVHDHGWREHAIARADEVRVIEPGGHPWTYYLGVLGMPGLTAYAGLFDVASFTAGEAVFVSAAGGAVGGLAGQFARLAGASRVVGSAGTQDKVRYAVETLGFDHAFNYKDGKLTKQLAQAFPGGFDVYFDNVGGDHLAAALEVINWYGRMALCGAVSVYTATEVPMIPGRLFRAIGKRLRLQGFIVFDHNHLIPEFETRVGAWLDSGELVYREHVTDGLEQMPSAFAGMLAGDNTGKAVIRLD
ncbi:NADP-dependent oxidoreductase [Aeromicrobium ginsengisoli]|uniref:NADP-dependent oxidoreductase n=2 Tax=Aeromicrobium ginsengisoli TaxID=363867 RepID=A0A5M4FJH6_9ACTN|nr:NADP-dependent oxidoreductase [Aeromicrobium ginsengisoli]KAA1400250.1 NADP-dependent oxidoreductase [Aeromicrobium ginsengisoli]